MSYLPRMSKTYKEPQPVEIEDEEDDNSGPNTLKPASSLLTEGTYNPQIALKQYKYLPHPLPVLPGPSVVDEAIESELSREISKSRRLSLKTDSQLSTDNSAKLSIEEEPQKEDDAKEEKQSLKPSQSRKTVRRVKSSAGRKKSSKISLDKKKEVSINLCLVGSGGKKSTGDPQAEEKSRDAKEDAALSPKHGVSATKRDKSLQDAPEKSQKSPKSSGQGEKKREGKLKHSTNRSVQCTIFGSAEKITVIPPVINCLLRALAFLLHEVNREEALGGSSGEKKSLMTQIQLILGDLCCQKVHDEFGFETTYSDSKRLEKILGDLQKYMKDVYGDKGEYIDRMEDLKRVFLELKKKEMELNLLNDKVLENEDLDPGDISIKESCYKYPEITLQNKRLESEQLLAEVEFSCRELRDYQKNLAEIEWEIRNYQDQMASLKKTIVCKSKTEILGRKSSIHKFSNEKMARRTKSKEDENYQKKKA